MLRDRHGRIIDYLRVSLTDQCNLRCVYCMPEDITFRPDESLLQVDELTRLLAIFARLGFHKIRFTGGEPTLRQDLVPLVRQTAALPGVDTVALTTNAIRLNHLAAPLAEAGLDRVNVSLDTLNPETYQRLTRWGNLDDVWAGLAAAEAAGLEVKLNAVVIRNLNDNHDVVELARLTLKHDWQIRFIEMMPFGEVAEFQSSFLVSEAALQKTITEALGPLTPINGGTLDGEARVFTLPNARGSLGFISSVTNPFCASCNRLRLTADGTLRLCLLRDDEVQLRPLLRDGVTDDELEAVIVKAVWDKPWGHGLADDHHPRLRVMSEIGG